MAVVTFVPGSILHAEDLNASFAGVLPLEGGTVTGPLEIKTTAPNMGVNGSFLILSSNTGTDNIIAGQTNEIPRWLMAVGDGTLETGANAGSEFILNRYADNGAFLGPALSIKRSNAAVGLFGALTLNALPVNAINDAAAASAGVGVGQIYRNGSVLMVRVA